jgi:hypothetical protein
MEKIKRGFAADPDRASELAAKAMLGRTRAIKWLPLPGTHAAELSKNDKKLP